VVASGYTTDGGTRQFLLATYAQDGNSPVTITGKDASIPTIRKGAAKRTPIQEVRVNGSTKMQIRRMRTMSSSFSDYVTAWYSPFLPPSNHTATATPVGAREMFRQPEARSFMVRWVPPAIKWLDDFLLPSAVAADTGASTVTKGPVSAQMVTTAFSEGESVSYAATLDASDNIIVVGTANGAEASSIVVAQYAAETVTDTITDQPGYRSSHIATTPSAEVTRTTAVIVGEIAPSFGKTVTRRGMVFSVTKDPEYRGVSEPDGQGPSVSTLLFDGLTNLLFTDAVAATMDSNATAETHFVVSGETANGSGCGTFKVLLSKLKPGTTYFARAYALTSEGAVYYGNQLNFRTADACFVATASFGTLLHPGVGVLRDFRDAFLVNTRGGQQLVAWYYTFSPPIADRIAGNGLLRFAVRLILLPIVGFSWLALQVGIVLALLTFIGSAIIFRRFSSRIFTTATRLFELNKTVGAGLPRLHEEESEK
jgi:hypothetical protein